MKFLGIILLGLLAGCSTTSSLLEGKKIDYKSATTVPSLEIPPDLTHAEINDRYSLPGQAGGTNLSEYQGKTGQVNNAVLPIVEKARIERAGTQRWLVVDVPAEQVWPVVRDFWSAMGFVLKIDSPGTGIVETDWAENRANIPQDTIRKFLGKVIDSLYSTSERDKFRTRLERVSANVTEIYISHRGMSEEYDASDMSTSRRTVWQPRPADPELEAEMLRRLMLRFGVSDEKTSTVLAQTGKVENAQLNSAENSLIINDNFDRAWRRLGLALDRVGFTVVDRDRSKGIYFVHYVDPEADNQAEDKGFLAKLAFWKSKDKKLTAENYQVTLKENAGVSQVQLLNKEGVADSSATASKILKLLFEQLK